MRYFDWNSYEPEPEPEPEQTFVCYAVEHPTFPDRMFGGTYFGFSSKTPFFLSGSAVYIGGGEVRVGGHPDAGPEVMMSNLIWLPDGLQLADKTVSNLVQPHQRIIVFVDDRNKESEGPSWRESDLTKVGLDVMRASDGTVYVGESESLHHVHWLDGVFMLNCSCLIASDQPMGVLERAIVDASASGNSVKDVLFSFHHRSACDPRVIQREMEGYSLYAGMGGNDVDDVMIARSDPDVSPVHQVIREAALELGVTLFDAGTITNLEPAFDVSGQWQLPHGWRKVT